MHLLYLGSGLSLGDNALMKFKRNAKFSHMLLASIQILRDPERMSRLLKIIFASKEMCQKAEKYYEDHFEQFIARYGRWSSTFPKAVNSWVCVLTNTCSAETQLPSAC